MNRPAGRIAVIGAGIVGVSAALWLQRDGHRVVILDRLPPGEGTSHGNGGVVACAAVVPVPMPGLVGKAPGMLLDRDSPLFLRWRYLPRLLPFLLPYLRRSTAAKAAETARHLTPLLGDADAQHEALAKGTAAARYLKPSDYLFAYRDRAAFEADALGWELRRANGITWETLEADALADFEPALSPDMGFGVRLRNHATVTDPGRYVKALAAHFEAEGGTILQTEVQDFLIKDGRLRGLRTVAGTVDCERAVIAGGAWSARLTAKLGVKTPLESERGYHLEFAEANVRPRCPIMVTTGKFVATAMEGRLRCAGLVEFGGLEGPAGRAPPAMLERQVRQVFPALESGAVTSWMGHRPAPIDSLPFLGEVPGAKGVYAAFGHHHVGLTAGPKSGRLIADLIADRHSNLDLAPYRVGRFA